MIYIYVTNYDFNEIFMTALVSSIGQNFCQGKFLIA